MTEAPKKKESKCRTAQSVGSVPPRETDRRFGTRDGIDLQTGATNGGICVADVILTRLIERFEVNDIVAFFEHAGRTRESRVVNAACHVSRGTCGLSHRPFEGLTRLAKSHKYQVCRVLWWVLALEMELEEGASHSTAYSCPLLSICMPYENTRDESGHLVIDSRSACCCHRNLWKGEVYFKKRPGLKKALVFTCNILLFKGCNSDKGMQLTALSLCVIVEKRKWQIHAEYKPLKCHNGLNFWDS